MKKDVSVSMVEGNLSALVAGLPLTALFFIFYLFIWGWDRLFVGLDLFISNPILFLIVVFAGIIIHELIHGLTWKFFGNKSSSAIKYGVTGKH